MTATTPNLIPHIPGEDGRPAPAPYVMTRDELLRFLRLPAETDDAMEAAVGRLKRKGLRAVRVGASDKFLLSEAVRFVESQREDLTR